MVARLGGDEFVVLVEGRYYAEKMTRIAERIQQKISSPFQLRGHEVFTTASIGILNVSEEHRASEDVIRDADTAMKVIERDKAVDDFYNSIFRTLLTYMMENPNNIGQSAHLLFIAKNVERVGDHATNIAEMVYYAATGQHMEQRPKGGDTTGQPG